MGVEIERKFIVADDEWRSSVESSIRIRQGYLSTDPERSVRVRIAGEQAWLTIKGESHGAARSEFEYPLPHADALALLDQLCLQPQIDKTRHRVTYKGHVFEIDEFHGENEGLLLAEVELDSAKEKVELPPWIGGEVTGYSQYYNSSLVKRPYSHWPRFA